MVVLGSLLFTLNGWTAFDTMLVLGVNVTLVGLLLVWHSHRETRRLHERLARVEDEWRFQHKQGTYVGSLEGLWKVLEIGLEQGGLEPGLRRAIYAAGNEMFTAFHELTSGDQLGAAVFWEPDRPRRGDGVWDMQASA